MADPPPHETEAGQINMRSDMYEEDKRDAERIYSEIHRVLNRLTPEDQSTILEKFEELLQFGNRMFTLVLVVGDENLYHEVSDGIQKHFEPSHQRNNQPVVLHFLVNHAKLFGKARWASQQHVDIQIKGYLNNAEPFVFYCDGSFSYVAASNGWKDGIDRFNELFRD